MPSASSSSAGGSGAGRLYPVPMHGKFITFEGGEGAGKSTQIRHLADRLTAAGVPVAATREPGGTPIAEAIRQVILSGRARELGPEGEAVLFAAARADHVAGLIRPSLADGRWVLSDRFIDSTRAYQGAAGGADARLLSALERAAVGDARPDLTLILDLAPEVGLGRVGRRLTGSEGELDRFESDALSVHRRRREAFLDIAAHEPERCVVIDAGRSEDEVANRVWQAVSARLLAKAA